MLIYTHNAASVHFRSGITSRALVSGRIGVPYVLKIAICGKNRWLGVYIHQKVKPGVNVRRKKCLGVVSWHLERRQMEKYIVILSKTN